MTLVLKSNQLSPLPTLHLGKSFNRPEGLLNSNYKSLVNYNFKHATSKSIFSIKQRIKGRRYQFASNLETLLKLSVFVVGILFII